jgi:hypothetical protein
VRGITDRHREDFAVGRTFGSERLRIDKETDHLRDVGPSGRGTRLASFTERFEASADVAAANWKWR